MISCISLINPPVTTEINILFGVRSFLIALSISATWNGFTARIITSLFFTASLLLLLISIPFFLKDPSVAVLRFVIIISDALLNLLFNNPSAMADPRLPPPMMVIRLLI